MTDDAKPESLAHGRFLQLLRRGRWEYVERLHSSGVVVMVAITNEGELVLVEQFRPALLRRVIELPAGLAGDQPESAGESLVTAARRELLEETGYRATELTLLAEGPSSAGLCNEVITFFRADGLQRVGPGGGDGSEQIDVHRIALAEVRDWLAARGRAGALVDPKVYAGLFLARAEA